MRRTRDQLIEITRRKERLIARSESQRAAVGESLAHLRGPIGIVDRGLEIARFLRGHPLLVVAAAAAAVAFRRRGVGSIIGGLLTTWRLWRSISALSSRLLA